ncbi:unnamed protein product, partial [marine sediment metagenome]
MIRCKSRRSATLTGVILVSLGALGARLLCCCPASAQQTAATSGESEQARPYPVPATAETRANPKALAALERPGKVIFSDGFESFASLKNYFEIRGLRDGRAKLVADPRKAHTGTGVMRFTAPAKGGKSSGSGASFWFGPS